MIASERPTLLRPQPGPETLKSTRWGGQRLAALRGAPASAGAIGESWELSTLPGRVSRARGQALTEHLHAPLPFLAKLIDTALPLSVQVHPDDRAETPGKEEAWMILDAEPGALVWAGLADGVSLAQLTETAARARTDRAHETALFDLLRAIPALPGTVIMVPAGTVHAIGGGILLAEIQQPSDCTYRLYDYGSGRQLHIDDASATIRADALAQVWTPDLPGSRLAGKHLNLEILGPGEHQVETDHRPRLVAVLRGRASIAGEQLDAGDLGLLMPSAESARVGLSSAPESITVIGRCD